MFSITGIINILTNFGIGAQTLFYGNYEIETILFLVTIIFVIMLTAYHFGNILEQ